jgi:RHS repeat-associated protein
MGSGSLLAQAMPDENPESNTGALKAQVTTGGSYDAHSGNATRSVSDLNVPDALGMYGLEFTRYWNSLRNEDTNIVAEWPVDFGGGWSHSWRWTAESDCEGPDGEPPPPIRVYTTSITITFPDGHATKFKLTRSNQYGGSENYCGQPFRADHGEDNWVAPGPHVHDRLIKMAQNGSEFWLARADGGAVHFVSISASHQQYQATEVFDPHGFRTDLLYDPVTGYLSQIKQEGWNRWLTLTWKTPPDYGAQVIASVESGGDGIVPQRVTYKYRMVGELWVLARVDYMDEPAPGQTASAYYTYGNCFGDTEPCPNEPQSQFPLLKTADDPHYSGAMTKIRYTYLGGGLCSPPPPVDPSHPPDGYYDWIAFPAEAIDKELSEGSTPVARFQPTCWSGLRTDYNGIGGWRTLYFGSSARGEDLPCSGLSCMGYALLKVTDYTRIFVPPASAPTRKQDGMEPTQVFDGRRIPTSFGYHDDSGNASYVEYADTSTCEYDRVNPNSSSPPSALVLDPSMHNKQNRWLFKKKDELGHFTTYTRDARRRVTDIAYHGGSSEQFTYNSWNQVTSHTLASGAIENYDYDQYHRLERVYNSVDRLSDGTIADKVYTYDAHGRVAEMIEGRAASSSVQFTVKMTYNGRHQVTSVEYPSTDGTPNPTVRYEYDKYGNCTAVIDELGHRKDYTYDSYRRCTSLTEQVNASGGGCQNVASRRWDWIYDRVIEGDWLPTRPASAHTSKEWRIQIEPEFNDLHQRRATARTFDFNNRMLSEETGWIQFFNEPLGVLHSGDDTEKHSFTYDPNGQKETATDPLLRVTHYTYDIRNRLETTIEPKRDDQQDYPVTRFKYDPMGNKTKVTFPDTQTQEWDFYDAFGQAWKFTDERHHVTDLVYCWGPMKKLYRVTTHREIDGGREDQLTTFSYDLMGRATQTLFPDGSDEFSTYKFGQLDTFKTRRNQTKRVHYDARGREDSHTWDNGSAPGITRVWDNANRLNRISNNFATIDYQYDDAGQMRTEGTTVAGSGALMDVHYCRYPSGQVSRITYPNGTSVSQNYTARGQLKDVDWGAGPTSYVYLKDGKVDVQVRPNGVTTSYGYDGRGMIGWVRNTKGGHDLARRDYWRDDRDRILAWTKGTDDSVNPMEDGRGDRYEYDWEGQLWKASYQALMTPPAMIPSQAKRSDIFDYDELGNRRASNYVASRGWMNFPMRDNKLNQYLAWVPYSAIYHDDNMPPPDPPPNPPFQWVFPGNGVVMQDGYITASYNALNQPVAIWSPAYPGANGSAAQYLWYGHDPLGRCVKRWMGTGTGAPLASNTTTYYYYDGWNLIQEGPSGGPASRVYVHGGRVDEIVASQAGAGGGWSHHHYDARGHCIMLTDTNGAIREQYDYDAFGYPYFYAATGLKLSPTNQWGNRFLFTGREWLKDLKVYDYRNRIYQPELGRFLQPDPKQFAAGDYNLYRYCHNDPVNASDPFGLDRFVLIVGEKGKDSHNQGTNFDRAAHTRAAELTKMGHDVDIKQASSIQEFNDALTTGPTIDGGAEYFGHGWDGALLVGEEAGADTNIDASNIGKLSNSNLGPNAVLTLNSCKSGAGADSIAQQFANQLNREVWGATRSMDFSGTPGVYPANGTPSTGPLYMVVDPGGLMRQFCPP